jgi:hypothetical protein
MNPEEERLQAKISDLNRQIGWLLGTLDSIEKGETLGMTPAEYVTANISLFQKRFGK